MSVPIYGDIEVKGNAVVNGTTENKGDVTHKSNTVHEGTVINKGTVTNESNTTFKEQVLFEKEVTFSQTINGTSSKSEKSEKLTTENKGNVNIPVYFEDGIPKQCNYRVLNVYKVIVDTIGLSTIKPGVGILTIVSEQTITKENFVNNYPNYTIIHCSGTIIETQGVENNTITAFHNIKGLQKVLEILYLDTDKISASGSVSDGMIGFAVRSVEFLYKTIALGA